MTLWMTALAVLVAAGAAARSTWSPCGVSMLSTITPAGERAKGHRFGATAAWFVLGATAGGATLGAVLAVLALGVARLSVTPGVLGLVALGTALVAAVSDAGIAGVRVPIHRRQVNERWLDEYRGWIYGLGFGAQLGLGLTTVVTSAATYAALLAALLSAHAAWGGAIGGCYGALRGLTPLLAAGIRTPPQLMAFHATMGRWQGPSRWAAVAVLAGAGLLAGVGAIA